MADTVFRIKAVMDVNDVVSNVGTIQKSLSKLKLPDNLKDNLGKNVGAFYKEYEKYQKRLADGIKTQGDYNQIEKSLNRMKTLYSDIGKDAAKAIKIDPNALFDLDDSKFKGIVDQIEQTIKQLSNIKVDTKAFTGPIEEIEKLTKNQKIVGEGGILTRIMGNIETGNISQAKKEYESLIQEVQKAAPKFDELGNRINKPGTFNTTHFDQIQAALTKMGTALLEAGKDTKPLEEELNRLQQELAETVSAASKDLIGNVGDYNKQAAGVEKVTDSLKRMHEEEYNFNRQAQDIDRQIQSYFGLSQMIRKVGEIARDAFQTVKELDAAMVETAVVTNFDVGDMWNMLPTYTANANQLGATIKDVYEAATLYFQQGLNLSQSMGLANETLKMARIGGLQAAEATNMMTAALRGFNMEINQLSAKRINDVYSELAAITAADTKEIGSAMERTASIANSANMEFETTSAFLAQMIETTREAPENLGTAMKTIIARFQEMKQDPTKLVDSEGVALDANKIDTALKTIGVELKNQKGEFRDLDDVFLDISERWDSLTQGQQRYIATIAAGSRQQSRFIAMMQNYERVKELVDAANNSAGAGQKQFEKTLEGLSAKLNKLKNAWDQFTMGLMNNQIIKTGIDALTGFFTIVNKIFDLFTKPFPDPFGGIIKSVLTLSSTLMMLNLGKKGARGLVMGGIGWWKNEGKFTDKFREGWGANSNKKRNEDGIIKQSKYGEAINQSIRKSKISQTIYAEFKKAQVQVQSIPWTTKLAVHNIIDRSLLNEEGKLAGHELWRAMQAEIDKGNLSPEQALETFRKRLKSETGYDIGPEINPAAMGKAEGEVEELTHRFDGLGAKISGAGLSLQQFGYILESTPLAPFGALLTKIGTLMVTFGDATITMGRNVAKSLDSAKKATIGMEGGFKKLKTGTSAFIKSLIKIPPQVLLILAAVAAVSAIVYKVATADKKALEATTDAAAAASEAFDLAKQETSELADAISRIQETDKAFDNLVAGTAEFNEQLVTANQQITELAQKYPMLNDYITTDKNGLMHISDEGLKAVKEYQKQIQARASAINIIQAADLAALENRQKADKLLQTLTTDSSERNKNREDARLLYDRAKADKQLAQQNAIRTALNAQEIKNVEAVSAVYADLYDTKRSVASVDVDEMSKQQRRQAYADYHGYIYNKSTKKMRDTEGNEVDYDDKVVKDEVIEQTVMLDFEENAGTLNNVLSHLDSSLQETLGNAFEGSGHAISDILSSNMEIDTDILEEVLNNSQDFQKVVNDLSEKEVAAILGISAEEIEKDNFDDYKNQVVDLLTEKATNLAEAQYESYEKLGAMMAEATYGTSQIARKDTNQAQIQSQIQDLKTYQANTMSSIGQMLQENVGTEAMKAFIGEASKIYLDDNIKQTTIDEFDNLINEINWESAASRLEGYNKAMQSTDETIQQFGESMRYAADEANVVGEAFDEFVSGDWEKLSENADNFKDAMGQIDGAGIMAAAEESKSLKSLLDSGEVSASAVAMALQGIEDGKYSVGSVNTAVLKLLSSLYKLQDVTLEAHKIVENFDPGIDTGEGEDFVKENAEKAKEYYDNGEWGNQQLQKYIQLAAGTDKWNETLQRNHGNLQETTKDLMKYVTTFSNGFQPAWDQMISRKNINGDSLISSVDKAIDEHRIDESLEKAYKKVKVFWDKNGYMNIEFGNLTTDELTTYFQEIYGVSEEYAKLLMQDLANYDATIAATLQKNDLQDSIESGDLGKYRQFGEDGRTILSDAEIQVIESAPGGAEALETIAKNLDYIDENGRGDVEAMREASFKTIDEETGKLREDYDQILKEYAETYFKNGAQGVNNLLNNKTRLRDESNRIDLNKMMVDMQSQGITDREQIQRSAWELYQQGNGKDFSFDGVKFKEGIKNYDEFVAEIEKGPEHVQWYNIGQSIADGILSVINKEDTSKESDKPLGTGMGPAGHQTDHKTRDNDRPQGGAQSEARDNLKNVGPTITSWLKGLFNPKDTKPAGPPKTSQTHERSGVGKNTTDTITRGLEIDEGAITDAAESESKKAGAAAESGALKIIGDVGDGATRGASSSNNTSNNRPRPRKTFTNNDSSATAQSTEDNKQTLSVNYTATIANATELQESLQKQLKTIFDAVAKQSQTLNVNATTKTTSKTSTKNTKGNKSQAKATAGSQVMRVTADVSAAQKRINNLISKFKKTYTLKYKASGPPSIKVPITANFKGPWEKKVKITKTGAKGINNNLPYNTLPALGSLAKGTRYGRLGPRGKGGLTLTGEKGYEIAWLPSESRSMILGAKGPQMINLPKDAVVYTHEQSEDILRKRQTIDAGSHALTGRRKPTTGITVHSGRKGSGSSGSSGNKKKKKKETINNWSIEEVVRFNIDLELAEVTDEIARRTKEIEKTLVKISARYSDIVDSTKDQIEALKAVQEYNQGLADSYQRQIDDYYERQAIVSWTTNKGKSKSKKINIKDYLNQDGSINYDAIEKISTRAQREAVFKEVNSVKELYDGMRNAKKAIEDAADQIADLGKKVSEAYYQWDNELTEVYDLTQRINNEVSLTNRFTSQIELELAKLNAGFGATAQAIENSRKVLARNNNVIQEQIKNQQQMVYARQRELQAALSTADELNNLIRFTNATDMDEATQQASMEWAQNQFMGAELGRKYVTNLFKDIDGSIQYEIDWEQFNADNLEDAYSKETYEAIKKYLDTLNDKATEFNNAIKEQTDYIKETYEALHEYQEFIANMEDTLIKGVEEEIEKESENAKKISESITNALKDLLDEVKRKLDERRKQEDNAKTERDIAQKQQRLAALRADTAGGHQVEIAQLEREIADAQQSYERTLEDQLLERLQQQADEASRQRERQIELAETANSIATETNKELVNRWLRDPERFKEEIKAAWLEAQGYDDRGEAGQYLLNQQFESEFTKLVTAIEQSGFNNDEIFSAALDAQGQIKEDTGTLVNLLAQLNAGLIGRYDELGENFGYNAENDATLHNTESNPESVTNDRLPIEDLHQAGVSADAARTLGYTLEQLIGDNPSNPIYSAEELREGGYTATELYNAGLNNAEQLKEGGYTAKELFDTNLFNLSDLLDLYSDAELKAAGFKAVDFEGSGVDYNRVRENFTIPELTEENAYTEGVGIEQAYKQFLIDRGTKKKKNSKDKANWGKLSKSAYLAQVARGEFLGKTEYEVAKELASTSKLDWNKVLKAAKGAGRKGKDVKAWNPKAGSKTGFRKAFEKVFGKWKKFAQGGIVDFTGPAWLDGSTSKPELVLNAQDTKNFLALRDVLGKAINSTSGQKESDNAFYEININVDHIANDYDVDRMAERIKKDIIKSAGYRNVTQVRNFK